VCGLDQRHTTKHVARVSALIPGVALAADQAFGFVKPQRGNGHPAAGRELADSEFAGDRRGIGASHGVQGSLADC
jgi:hypothetical protein